MRWNLEDINNGYKKISSHYNINFEDVFKQKSMIKIDFIVLIDGIYTECSISYFFYIVKTGFDTTPENYQIHSITMYQEYQKYIKLGDYYKACKRLFNFFRDIKDKVNMNRIARFLNSDIGFYNYILSHLDNIKTLLDLDENINIKNIKSSLKNLLKDTKFIKYVYKINDKQSVILLINTINDMLKSKVDEQ